jgi:hypothetical protein
VPPGRSGNTTLPQDASRPLDGKEQAVAGGLTIKDITIPEDGLNSDIHASAEYPAHLVGVMARRAVAGCG